MFVLYSLKSDYWTLNEGCGRAGNLPCVILNLFQDLIATIHPSASSFYV